MKEQGAALLERFAHCLRFRGEVGNDVLLHAPARKVFTTKQRYRGRSKRGPGPRGEPTPGHAAAQAELVDLAAVVIGDARGQYLVLPGGRGKLEAFELLDHRHKPFDAPHLVFAGDVLPVEEEAHEVCSADRLYLRP